MRLTETASHGDSNCPTPECSGRSAARPVAALRLLNADRIDDWQAAYDRVWSTGLELRSHETGKDAALVCIDGGEAWFRG